MLVGYRACDPPVHMTFFSTVLLFDWLPRLAQDQSVGTLGAMLLVNLEMRPA